MSEPARDGYAEVAKALGMPAPKPHLRVVRAPEVDEAADDSRGVWRPSELAEFVGQQRALLKLKMHVVGALRRGEQPGHVLLSGPPGLGKTALSAIVASLINEGRPEGERVGFHQAMGTSVRVQRQLAKVLAKVREGDVLFVDEAHQMGEKAEEMLGLAMEDGRVAFTPNENAEPIVMRIPPFTLVAASTRPAHLSRPLRDRMQLAIRMEWYSVEELAEIVGKAAGRDGVKVTPEAALMVAQVGRQTPRITLSVWAQVMGYASLMGADEVDADVVELALDVAGLDSLGLDERDREYLTVVASWSGRRIGLEPVSAKSGLNSREITDDIEPFLLRAGMLDLSSRGRCLSKAAYAHLWPEMSVPPLLGLS